MASNALVEYQAPAPKEEADLEVKLRRILDNVPVRVNNTSGSSAGSGSGDFHQISIIITEEEEVIIQLPPAVEIKEDRMQPTTGYDLKELVQKAQNRWLKPAEVLFILQNHENDQLTEAAPQKPPSGSLFLFNKRVLRFFRKDGHIWRKKKDGKTVGEAHERLKVRNVEALNCYYAHGELNPNFQRRSYWILDPAYEHIVLVHYREINEVRHGVGSISHGSPGSAYTPSQSPSFSTAQPPSSTSAVSEYQASFSPGSVEVSSNILTRNNGVVHLDANDQSGNFSSSPEEDVSQALRKLEEQLSLNENDMADLSSYYNQSEKLEDSTVLEVDKLNRYEFGPLQCLPKHCESAGVQDGSKNNMFLPKSGDVKKRNQQSGHEYTIERKESPCWKEMQELCSGSNWMGLQEKTSNTFEEKPFRSEVGKLLTNLAEQRENWNHQGAYVSENLAHKSTSNPTPDSNLSLHLSAAREFLLGSDNLLESPTSELLSQNVEIPGFSAHSSEISTSDVNTDYFTLWFDQETQLANSLRSDTNLTLAESQRFSIREISPEQGYATENTKVIITGSFLCDPSECAWACMFGDIEVPVEIIQEGVFRCQAPQNVPGKVTLCITSGNRVSCSEVREFEYLIKPGSDGYYNSLEMEPRKSREELLLLVRFAQMLITDTKVQGRDNVQLGASGSRKSKMDEEIWGHIIEELLVGSATPYSTMDWLLQELLKEKMQQWLMSKNQEGDTPGCSLSRKEQGMIHMVGGLGFEWALNPILRSGVSVNFRDANGWTALHWAAHFGREKMVASLVAAGASALAVTDPTPLDPAGKTPGLIAAASGHKGLAGYLSELALTSHLSSLKLAESEISKGSAAVEAERTVEIISNKCLGSTEDQLSLKDSLAAVRNAAQAAARIQCAFRTHSFRRRQQKEAASTSCDEYGIAPYQIHGLSAASKLAFRNQRDHKLDNAALSIQKKYRGWKRRKDFLSMRQNVVKIQAHVRGHQVRKKYVFLWAVGVLDKVVLRWRRRGAGLRGFRHESEATDDAEDEDTLKAFRKQKVDLAVEEAVSQVLSMVESPDARQQYRRMLETYRKAAAKEESHNISSETGSTSQGNIDNMEDENNELYMFA